MNVHVHSLVTGAAREGGASFVSYRHNFLVWFYLNIEHLNFDMFIFFFFFFRILETIKVRIFRFDIHMDK